jgi:hypothetical protein
MVRWSNISNTSCKRNLIFHNIGPYFISRCSIVAQSVSLCRLFSDKAGFTMQKHCISGDVSVLGNSHKMKWLPCTATVAQDRTWVNRTYSHSQNCYNKQEISLCKQSFCALSVPAFLVLENIIHMAVIINIQFSSYFNLHQLALKSPCNHCWPDLFLF